MDNPNITMEEYIRLQEEKSLRHGRTFNWQTTTYGKVKYCEDEDGCFTNFETEFPAIVFDDTITSDTTLSCEPTVSPLNENEIDFRISFDESEDEDYTLGRARRRMTWRQFILALGLHTSDEMVKDGFEAYWLGSERVIPDKGDLRDYWIEISSDRDFLGPAPQNDCEGQDMALPQRDQRHPYLRFEGLKYTDADIHTFEDRLERIFRRQIHRVQVLDFAGLTEGLGEDVDNRLRMVHSDEQGHDIFVSDAWRWLLDIKGPLVSSWGCYTPDELEGVCSWHAEGRKSGAQMSGGHFIACLADHFRLLTKAGLQRLTIKARDQIEIYLDELDRIYIYEELADT
ncbi:hypothetical protein Tco_1135752 [Tanacetum coccineum]